VPRQPDERPHRAFLLVWNVKRWIWRADELAEAIRATEAGQTVSVRWTTGGRRSGISVGDRGYLLKLGAAPRGIVGSGTFQSEIYPAEHWEGADRHSYYADIELDVLVDPDDPLRTSDLGLVAPNQSWHPQGSGVQLRPEYLAVVEELWKDHIRG
jgi:hypothetical protein